MVIVLFYAVADTVDILVVIADRCSTASRIVLLGIVPVLIHTPPTEDCFSTIATRFPALAA